MYPLLGVQNPEITNRKLVLPFEQGSFGGGAMPLRHATSAGRGPQGRRASPNRGKSKMYARFEPCDWLKTAFASLVQMYADVYRFSNKLRITKCSLAPLQ